MALIVAQGIPGGWTGGRDPVIQALTADPEIAGDLGQRFIRVVDEPDRFRPKLGTKPTRRSASRHRGLLWRIVRRLGVHQNGSRSGCGTRVRGAGRGETTE